MIYSSLTFLILLGQHEVCLVHEKNPRIEVIFEYREFIPGDHELKKPKQVLQTYQIDGKIAWGTNLHQLPITQLTKIFILLNDKKIEFENSLFDDCFNPGFDDYSLAVDVNQSLDAVFVFMQGGENSTSYNVVWALSFNGFGVRYINKPPDCLAFDVECIRANKSFNSDLIKLKNQQR